MQQFADELGLSIDIHRLPPGTQQVEQDRTPLILIQIRRAKPLISYRLIVALIGAAATSTGLTIRCELDETICPKGILTSDEQMQTLNISRDDFRGKWN